MAEIATEIAVIGAGPGGYAAAIRLGQLGKKVLLIEPEHLGGTCLNWGCIPSKALISFASLYEKMKKAESMGLQADALTVNLEIFQQWKRGMVAKLTQGIATLCKNLKIEILSGRAFFQSDHELEISSNGAVSGVRAENFVIAAGAAPILLPEFSLSNPKVMTSKEALDLTRVPETFLVIGGGIVGLELGIAFQKLGSRLIVIEKSEQLLFGTDAELVRYVERSMKKRGAEIYVSSQVLQAQEKGNTMEVLADTPEGKKNISADAVLTAVGVKPLTQGFGVETIGIQTDSRGFIRVNEQFRTNIPRIFAIGDIHGPPFLAHKAFQEGELAAEVIAGVNRKPDSPAIPLAVFTHPEIASVGLSEREAREGGKEILVGRYPLSASGRALTIGEPEGLMKIVAEKKTGKILGFHLVCPEASELIGEGALAIRLGAHVEDLASTIHPHPTLSEGFWEGAKQILGKAIHIPNP